jgi:hypothetical protein
MPRPASAQEVKAVEIQYEAPADCPGADWFWERIAAREAALVRSVVSAEPDVSVTIESADGEFAGAVTFVPSVSPRQVRSRSCSDVAEALALIVAVSLGRDDRDTEHTVTNAPVALEDAATPPDPRLGRASPELQVGAGLGVSALTGALPSARPAFPLFAQVRIAETMEVRLGAIHSTDETESMGGMARFALTAGVLDGCLARALAGRAEILPCAVVEVGAISSAGLRVDDPQRVTRLWLAPGAGARVRWPRAASYFVEAGVAALFPLTRDRYYLTPSTTVFEISPVNIRAGVGVGVTIW